MSQQIITNLKVLIDHLHTLSEDDFSFGLNQYRSECRTKYCSLGHATTMPYFNDLGLRFSDFGSYDEDEKVEEIFGMDSMINCFGTLNGIGPFAPNKIGIFIGINDTLKNIAISRLVLQIDKIGAME